MQVTAVSHSPLGARQISVAKNDCPISLVTGWFGVGRPQLPDLAAELFEPAASKARNPDGRGWPSGFLLFLGKSEI